VAASLDDWALERRRLQRPPADWQRLVALARAVDRDPWRTALRSLDYTAIGKERQKLLDLADTAKVSELPPASAQLLGRALRAVGEQDQAEAVLRDAQRLHPGDVWLNYELADLLQDRPALHGDEIIRFYTAARASRPEIGHALGHALKNYGRKDEALAVFMELTRLRPDNPRHHNCLGNALFDKKQLDGAIHEFRAAIALDPKLATPHNNLGNALRDKKELDEAIQEYRAAIALDPKDAMPHNNLGIALSKNKELDEAIKEYRAAIALDPKYAMPHKCLGNALYDKKELDEAILEYRAAIALDPKDARPRNNLGNALRDKKELDEAIKEYRAAIALDPKDAMPHNNLGIALSKNKELDEAIKEYRAAIALDANFAAPHSSLGDALYDKKELDEAMKEYRAAIALDPKFAAPHNGLGNALYDKKELDEAIEEYQNAINIDGTYGPAHGALGRALLNKGRFAQAGEATRRCLKLLPEGDPNRNLGTQQLRQCEQLLDLDKRLPAILEGKEKPADAERVKLALLCVQPYKRLYAAAARFYAEALDAEPELSKDPANGVRYNAACAAALAAAGKGNDANKLEEKERARLRQQAREWLTDDLALWSKQADNQNPKAREAVHQQMKHWQTDDDLAGVRDRDALDKLPEAERDAWRKLWDDVAAVLAKAGDAK
jgi:tetratricopeptide (TPR) repeat protein